MYCYSGCFSKQRKAFFMSKMSSRRKARLVPRLERLEAREVPAIKLLTTLEGLTQAQGGFFDPPDTTLAVGPSRIVEQVNTGIALFEKSGTRLDSMRGEPFFGKTSNDFVFDPLCVYDEYSGRFIAAALQLDSNNSK